MSNVLLSRWAWRVSRQDVTSVRSTENCSHLVWQKSKSRARNSRQRPCPICSVTTAPCPALHKSTAFGHSHFPLICGSSLPITTPYLSVPSYVFSWLPSSPYLLTLLRTPQLINPAVSSIFWFFNLSTQEWPCFFLKDNHEEHSRNSLLHPPHAWREFFLATS